MAQVGNHPALVDGLQPAETRRVDHLSPEGEPDRGGAAIEFLWRKVRIDHRVHPVTRIGDAAQPARSRTPEAGHQVAQGRFEQPVLVAEIMGDEPRRDPGPPGNLAKRAGAESDIGQRFDRGIDQLAAALILDLGPGKRRLAHRIFHREKLSAFVICMMH